MSGLRLGELDETITVADVLRVIGVVVSEAADSMRYLAPFDQDAEDAISDLNRIANEELGRLL